MATEMEPTPTVKVQVTLSMDLHPAEGQTNYDLARSVQHQVNVFLEQHYLGRIDNIKIFEEQGSSLTLSTKQPAVELGGKEGDNGWELAQKNPIPPKHGTSTLPLGASRLRPTIREKKKPSKRGKKAVQTPKPKMKKTQDQQFGHEFEEYTFSERYRRQGISAALGPQFSYRVEKTRARSSARDDQRRWKGYGKPDEDKQMEIINDRLAAVDLEASQPTKAELKAERRAERKAKRWDKFKAVAADNKTEDAMETAGPAATSTEIAVR